MRVRIARLAAAAAALAVIAAPATAPSAAEPEILYPATVTTMQGRVLHFEDLRTDLARGSFVFYDGNLEGRVSWRDIDRITFVANIRHRPEALGPKRRGTERVVLRYADGEERVVNLVVGRFRGFDGHADRELLARHVAMIDFDTVRIAPALYKTCEHGHVWEQPHYRYCPYEGLPLVPLRLDGGPVQP